MKPTFTAFVFALSLAASPVLAFSVDMSSLTPTLTYPDPAPQPVTKDQGGISK
ncbi:hypothetical protein [uncultured Roseovarius sp.]|uniref:hypothetical protein n=1 Tax=uncultured Roseovarius sp. TaxID=293344 RepID=UPI002614B1A9|nr:hypothetical protein [uncultured Roseovarius sp.]